MIITIGPDLDGLSGVPSFVTGLSCPQCDLREANVCHARTGEAGYSASLSCDACGAVYELDGAAYTAGLSVGVIVQRARRGAAS